MFLNILMIQRLFLFSSETLRDPLGDYWPHDAPILSGRVSPHIACVVTRLPSLRCDPVPARLRPARLSVVLWSSHSADLTRAGSGDKKSCFYEEKRREWQTRNESLWRLKLDRSMNLGCVKTREVHSAGVGNKFVRLWAELWSQRRHCAHKILCLDKLVRISETVFAIMW